MTQVVTIEYRAILPIGTIVTAGDDLTWTRHTQGWESEYGQWGNPPLPLTIIREGAR